MLEDSIITIPKKYAMTIGSKAWRQVILDKTTNIASGFKAAGLWPLSFPDMQSRLKLFMGGSITDSEENPTWIRCRDTVQLEVQSIPTEIDRQPQMRRKIDVNNRVLLI